MDALWLAKIFIAAFFAVCFIQSGFDKVFDWKGNLTWLTGHFSKTFLAKSVSMMLGTVTLVEVSAGLVNAGAVVTLLLHQLPIVPTIGLALVSLNFVMLFAGQRIAKDYAGAAGLTGYFTIAIIGLLISGVDHLP